MRSPKKTESSVDNTGKPADEIIVGAPSLQTFSLKVKKLGTYDVHFELTCPWEDTVLEEFGFSIVTDDVLNYLEEFGFSIVADDVLN